jgi:hypothetical protein
MSTAAELFSYNRENFKFNMEQRQRSLYMQQNMRVRQVLLYRQDMKDLFELTVGKMDAYMMVNVLMLGITAEMYYKGRAPLHVPSWLFWCWGISLSGAFFFLFFSTWLALHASVLSQTYMARCLSQWLRLPIPSVDEINSASARLEDYESNTFLDFVRPPVVVPMGEKMGNRRRTVRHSRDLSTSWTEFLDHFSMFNSLHHKWSSHEAYARVSMCMGTNHLLAAFSYFALSYYSVEYENPWIGTAFVLLATLAQLIYLKMSLNLTEFEHYIQIVLVVAPPMLMAASAAICSTGYHIVPDSALIIACVGYGLHFLWVLFFLFQTKHDNQELPIKFSTVWCIDVLGVGVRTIRDIEEPRVDFPGFNPRGEVDPSGRPLNTYDLSFREHMDGKGDGFHPNDSIVPPDIVSACEAQEKKLHAIFALWNAQSRDDITDPEISQIEELKAEFYDDKDKLLRVLGVETVMGSALSSAVSAIPAPSSWVRINQDEEPFLLNVETGEIKPDDEPTGTAPTPPKCSVSDLPIETLKYHELVRKIEYAIGRDMAVQRQKKARPPTWPYELFRAGGVLILICWASAVVETVINQLGLENGIEVGTGVA